MESFHVQSKNCDNYVFISEICIFSVITYSYVHVMAQDTIIVRVCNGFHCLHFHVQLLRQIGGY